MSERPQCSPEARRLIEDAEVAFWRWKTEPGVRIYHQAEDALASYIERLEARIKELEALVGTIRGLAGAEPVRNVSDVDVETHSREIIAAIERQR